MNEIILTDVIPSHDDLQRLHLFAGRHLGEEEFDRQQAYMDRRLAPLLAGDEPGIVHGLQVRTAQLDTAGESFTVNPGLAVAGNGQTLGLFYPLRESWSTLIEDYLAETHSASAAGLYYLTLRRASRHVDADPDIDPCQREEFDPTRDARRLVVGTLGLQRLAIDTAAVAANSRELLENWVAANHVDALFLRDMQDAVPLGLLAISLVPAVELGEEPHYAVRWFSEASGRYLAIRNSGYRVLLRQVSEAFRRLLLRADEDIADDTTLAEYLRDNLLLDFLPAAGELPQQLLTDIAGTAPGVSWLPRHLGVDMVAVPESAVPELIARHLPRRVVDLRLPAGARLRLLLAVTAADYKPDLLDLPQTDRQLQEDVFRYFMRAYDPWKNWMQQFNHLYALLEDDVLPEDQLKALDLPEAIAAPQLPQDFYAQIISSAEAELGSEDDPGALYPYNQGVPDYPRFYRNWGVVAATDLTNPPVLPPPLPEPVEDGLLIQYSVARVDLEALDNEIRAVRARLEKTRDFLMLQRQQLDNQTVSLASLAGGVAGDGSGLQVARWLPFSNLTAQLPAQPEATPSAAPSAPVTATAAAVGLADAGAKSSGASPVGRTTSNYIALGSSNVSKNFAVAGSSGQTATKTAGGSSNFLFSTALWSSPSSFSAMQFSYNSMQLNRIAAAPRQALTKPAFEPKVYRFGTIEHIRPEIQEYKKAVRGMSELLTTLDGLFDVAEAKSIKATLNRYGKPKSLEDLGIDGNVELTEDLVSKLYEALFDAGKILTKQIAYMEGRYARIEARLEGRLRARLHMEARIEKLLALINRATQELQSLDSRRIEFLGDYGVTQHLLDEDWAQVYRENQERTRILTTAIKGLYFVRERQTPVSLPLADPLELRHGKASDIVPGCNWQEDVQLPEELEEFFDTVLEVAMHDWAALQGLQVHVPPLQRLEYISRLRTVRLQSKLSKKRRTPPMARPVKVSLFNVQQQTQSVLAQMASLQLPLAQVSAKQRQRQTARVLSLEDILSGSKGYLGRQGQTLHNHLQQAIACLLSRLNELPPSLRLQWAQLAEDDRLPVDQVQRWPGLERAEREDFNTMRSIVELLAWWFRQLQTEASAEAQGAMRNMIRACVIHSALGDPQEILHGQVHVPPRRLAPGEQLRLRLNRAAEPGTVLQLMDVQQTVVAVLKVDDHDQNGTIANISQVTRKDVVIDTRFRVVASQMTRQLLV